MQADFKKYDLTQATATEAGRFAMQGILIEPEQKRAVATNGRILAIVPLESVGEHDSKGIIPAETWKAAAKATPNHGNKPEVTVNGAVTLTTRQGTTTTAKLEGDFPRYESVIPTSDRVPVWKIRISAGYLLALAKAIGSPKVGKNNLHHAVTLEVFLGPHEPIRVTCTESDGVGYIMPIVVEE